MPDKIPGDLQYQRPLSVDMRFVSSPSGRAGVHSSFRNLASFVKPGASLSSHRRYRKDRHIHLPVVLPESWRNMQREREQEHVFFPPQWAVPILCFLISKRIHCPAVVLSLCGKKMSQGMSLCTKVSLGALLFCCCKWIHLIMCVHLSVLPCFCVYF